jgi:hypothetical protein
MQSTQDIKNNGWRKRGVFLIIMIWFLIIGDLQIPYYLIHPDVLKTIYSSVPWWYAIYALIGLASNIAIIIGIWRMKKWAAFLLAVYFISKIWVDSIYVLPAQESTVFLTSIIGAGLWYWAIYRKWGSFD